MRVTVKMPKVSDTDDLVVVVQWLQPVGAAVAAGDGLVEVESSKATVQVPSPLAGTVAELLVAVDDEVLVGSRICVLDTP